jgi:serine/threonine-protein kinase
VPSPDPLIGRVLAERYEIVQRIGRGGMGIVYGGRQAAVGRNVAIKVLTPDLVENLAAIKRFEREARAASRLAHPNIVTVYDFGQTEDGLVFLVMELLQGEPLRATILRESPMDPARALEIIAQLLDALGAAHAAGIVHRDLKPENLFRTQVGARRDFIKVLDFGIAKFHETQTPSLRTATGVIFGTLEYMAPEQALGQPADHRADIYATGLILFEMLTGRIPFVDETPFAMMNQRLHRDPPLLHTLVAGLAELPWLQGIVNGALAREASQRFDSASAMLDAIALGRAEAASPGERRGSGEAVNTRPYAPVLDAPTLHGRPPASAPDTTQAPTAFRRIATWSAAAAALTGAVVASLLAASSDPEPAAAPAAAPSAVAPAPTPTPPATPSAVAPAPAPPSTPIPRISAADAGAGPSVTASRASAPRSRGTPAAPRPRGNRRRAKARPPGRAETLPVIKEGRVPHAAPAPEATEERLKDFDL